MSAASLLQRLPGVYADLADAAQPPRTGEPSDAAPDPLNKPAPGRLDVMEHRHKLVRGLRWWVDAVGNDSRVRVGQSVTGMCAFLLARLPVMAAEDTRELAHNLDEWLDGALEFMGSTAGRETEVVRVADAAAILGCSVRTIQRRVPPARRVAGMVLLGDAMERCDRCDLIVGQCEHTT